jgi:hypothetical protein
MPVRVGVGMSVRRPGVVRVFMIVVMPMIVAVTMIVVVLMAVSMLVTVCMLLAAGKAFDPGRGLARQSASAIVTHYSISNAANSISRPARKSRLGR